MAVGVGSGVDSNELRSIAMNNSENVMKLSSFDRLAGSLRNLTKELCRGTDTNLVFKVLLMPPRCNGGRLQKMFRSVTHAKRK